MRILVVRLAMCGPPGVANANMGMKVFTYDLFFQASHLAFLFVHFQPAVQQRHTGTIVAAVLQPFQPFQDDRVGFAGTYISNDSTHMVKEFFSGAKENKNRQKQKIEMSKSSL
jgi:hypothetical protein